MRDDHEDSPPNEPPPSIDPIGMTPLLPPPLAPLTPADLDTQHVLVRLLQEALLAVPSLGAAIQEVRSEQAAIRRESAANLASAATLFAGQVNGSHAELSAELRKMRSALDRNTESVNGCAAQVDRVGEVLKELRTYVEAIAADQKLIREKLDLVAEQAESAIGMGNTAHAKLVDLQSHIYDLTGENVRLKRGVAGEDEKSTVGVAGG